MGLKVSFLERKIVKIENSFSISKTVDASISQGSSVSAAWFLVFINPV